MSDGLGVGVALCWSAQTVDFRCVDEAPTKQLKSYVFWRHCGIRQFADAPRFFCKATLETASRETASAGAAVEGRCRLGQRGLKRLSGSDGNCRGSR